MKKVSLIIGILCGLIISVIPPFSSTGQVKDCNIIQRVNSFNARVDAVEKKADRLAPVVADNLDKIQTVDSLLSVKTPVRIVTKVRTVIKEKPVVKKVPVPVPTPSDEQVFIVSGQYVNRPIIIQPACRTYGGEAKYMTFSQWRSATGEKSEKKYKAYLKSLGLIK